MDYLEIVGGIILLIISGRLLVKGGVEIAARFKISNLVVGMTVVAFGTSAPELIVSISAAFKGSPEIALGNVIGSNISNMALVLAITGLIIPIPVQRDTVRYDWKIMMVSFILLALFMSNDTISRLEGIILFTLLIVYIWWEIYHSKKVNKQAAEDFPEPTMSVWLAVLYIALASAGLAFGADWLVDGAVSVARKLNVSERIISITIVAIGTSLPELTASLVAAFKGKTDISVGNIIGSNVFNIFSIVGLTAIIHPMHFNHAPFMVDLIAMALIGILLYLFIYPFRSIYITRDESAWLLVAYLAYIAFILNFKMA